MPANSKIHYLSSLSEAFSSAGASSAEASSAGASFFAVFFAVLFLRCFVITALSRTRSAALPTRTSSRIDSAGILSLIFSTSMPYASAILPNSASISSSVASRFSALAIASRASLDLTFLIACGRKSSRSCSMVCPYSRGMY